MVPIGDVPFFPFISRTAFRSLALLLHDSDILSNIDNSARCVSKAAQLKHGSFAGTRSAQVFKKTIPR